ncbi:MAG: LysR family transcriptional regulator [Lachnospiraceae bacterium]|jgi:DNA-binding transcriptional LysR family regulator|nr:LysR family transcriptional regulator [Lachnospiraceae bacterium]
MNIKHAQYMLTILQEGGITNAARKLYVSQPSLSQMVKQVENNLGAPIFNRSKDPLTLTYAGQRYMDAARQVLAIHENLKKEIEEINHEDHGKFRLGIPVQRGMQLLPCVLPVFFAKYPHVAIELTEYGSTETEKLLLDGKVDIACMTTIPRYEELQYILIENEELILLASKNTDLARRIPNGTPISILEAKNEHFISNKPGHSVRAIQDVLFASHNISPKLLIESASIEIEKKMAIACNAVMICPLGYIDKEGTIPSQAYMYPLKDVDSKRHCYACHRKDLYLTKYMRDFISILTEYGSKAL